jgi:protocatechuate 3,4-dioxygenase beta subunit
MRFALFVYAAVCLAQSAPDKSAVVGRVVSATTSAPLKKASVWLERFSPTRGVNGERSVALSTVTDAEGRFTLDGVDPGEYLLLAQRVGYLDQGYGAPAPQVVGPPFTLAAGDTMRDITVKLTPQSLLYGKVVDEDGDPVIGAWVEVLHVSYAGGKRRLVETGNATSQGDGSFVAGNLTPGRYYLAAGVPGFGDQLTSDRERYVVTYFPNTADPTAAAPVEVGPGAEVRNLAIRVRKSRVYTVRGRVTPPARVTLRVDGRGVATEPDGRFQFDGVLPGAYEIQTNNSVAFYSASQEETVRMNSPLVGRASIVVTDGDLDDVVVHVGPGASVTGALKGAPSAQIVLGNQTARVRPDGGFTFEHLLPEVQSLEVSGLPDGSYVKSVQFAGHPVDDWKIDLSSGEGGALFIEVSPNAGEVSGVIPDSRGAVVQIWPADGDTARSVKTDARGEFRFKSLPPGDYLVAAFQDLDDDLAQCPPFRRAFESQAAKVKIAEKGRERAEVKLIGRDAIAAEAARLQ